MGRRRFFRDARSGEASGEAMHDEVSGGDGLGRREFLAASAALFGGLAAAAPEAESAAPVKLPASATKENAKAVIVGPQIPVITCLKKDLSIDPESVRLNVNYFVEHGFVTGKGVLLGVGAGGDFDALNLDERKTVARAIVEAADGRVPVIVGAQSTDTRDSLEMARYSESLGAYGIQVGAPYYHVPADDDYLKYVRGIHDATKKIGLMIYNTWWHGYNIPPAMMDKLLDLERVVIVKWSHPGGPLDYAQGVKRLCRRVSVIDNAKMCVLTHLLGGHGFISHFASVWPEHELKVWDLCRTGRHQEAMDLYSAHNYPWVAFRGKIGGRTSGESPPVKAGMELAGRPGGPCRPPSRDLTPEEREELRSLLRTIGVPGVA